MIEAVESKIEEILSFYSRHDDGKLLALGKKKYFEITGTVDHDTQDFEHKMNSFTEWFVLHFSPYRSGVKVFETYAQKQTLDASLIEQLREIHYSVFDPLEDNSIRDCISGKMYTLDAVSNPYMVVKGEIFVGRILPGKETFLLKGTVPMPQEVRDFVLSSAKQVSERQLDLTYEQFCLNLESMKYKCLQYQHIDPLKFFVYERGKLA